MPVSRLRALLAGTATGLISLTLLVGTTSQPAAAGALPAQAPSVPQQWRQLAPSEEDGCGIDTAGSLWCWGENYYGELGLGDGRNRLYPTQVEPGTQWSYVSTAWYAACAVRSDGTLWCWGYNNDGLLGLPGTNSTQVPLQVGDATDWTSVDMAVDHSCGTRTDGTLWCWGSNEAGDLGDGPESGSNLPQQVGSDADWRFVSAGSTWDQDRGYNCALKTDGTLWCWGANRDGELGIGTRTNVSRPTQVGTDTDWMQVSAGATHTCAVQRNHSGWCWGADGWGELGNGLRPKSDVPSPVAGSHAWSTIDAGAEVSCGLGVAGHSFCWGDNESGLLGDGAGHDIWLIPHGTTTTALETSLDVGFGAVCAVTTTGRGLCWGKGGQGQLADGGFISHSTPHPMLRRPNLPAPTWAQVSAGDDTACAIDAASALWCWGGVSGREGVFQGEDGFTYPIRVGTQTGWTQVSVGHLNVCAIRTDKSLWCWGSNGRGQNGVGNNDLHTAPQHVGAAEWRAVSVGKGPNGSHVCGIQQNGSLWCWGNNEHGELGDGTTVRRLSPVRVGTSTDWRAVTSGALHTCATRDDGSLWCWGDGHDGQLGLAMSGDRHSPAHVTGASIWTQSSGNLTAGHAFTCAEQTDHTLWCWGANESGQLGQGSATSSERPVQVGTLSTWGTVRAGTAHVCARQLNGSLWCWGDNDKGQLGIGDQPDQSLPKQVTPPGRTPSLAAGAAFSCAIGPAPDLWCWGTDDRGELGIGQEDIERHDTPGQVLQAS